MFAFDLADISVDGLKKWAAELGHPISPAMSRETLETAIRNRARQQNPLVIASLTGSSRKERLLFAGTLIAAGAAAITACLTLVIAIANWRSAKVANDLYTAQLEQRDKDGNAKKDDETKKELEHKKLIVVYGILDKGIKNEPNGLSFNAIRSKYLEEVQSRKLPAEEKTKEDETLQTLLYGLVEDGLVSQTEDDHYIPKKGKIVPIDRFFPHSDASICILEKLSKERGKHTASELGDIFIKEGSIKSNAYYYAINQLIGTGLVRTNTKGKLYAVAFPPSEDEK